MRLVVDDINPFELLEYSTTRGEMQGGNVGIDKLHDIVK